MSDIFDHACDAYDQMDIDDCGFEPSMWNRPYKSYKKSKTCKYCGKAGLFWRMTDDGWRLHDAGKPHTCRDYHKAQKNERLHFDEVDRINHEGRPKARGRTEG